jgi:uncharacterized metal-binding protein
MCASNVLRQKGINITYEVTVAKEEINKLPSLDFSDKEVEKIAVKIISEFLSKYIEITE